MSAQGSERSMVARKDDSTRRDSDAAHRWEFPKILGVPYLGFTVQGLGFRLLVIWEFPKIRVPYFGVLIIGILLFRVLY